MTNYVYTLSCPNTNIVMYIGRTNNLESRLYQHVYEAATTHDNSKKNIWLRDLIALGKTPLIEALDSANSTEAIKEMEYFYISYFKHLGFSLVNHVGYHNRKTIPNKNHNEVLKTIKFPEPMLIKIGKLAKKKQWSFHKTVLILLTAATK